MANTVNAFATFAVPSNPNRPKADHIFLRNLSQQPNLIGQSINLTSSVVYAQANAARDQANVAYTQANSAFDQANDAFGKANIAFSIAEQALIEANGAFDQANSAYAQANAAYGQANAGYAQANAAYGQANSAYAAANASGNTVAVFANGTLVLAGGNLNFNNTATTNVAITANGSVQTNVTLIVNTFAVLTTYANNVPASNVQARALTGLVAVKTSNTACTANTLTADSTLTVTLNEIGVYSLSGYLSFYETANGTGGFAFNLAAGTVGLNWINWVAAGNTTVTVSNSAALAANVVQSFNPVSSSNSAPSWIEILGTISTSNTGTFGVSWGQSVTSANATNLLQGSQLTLTKIG